ncbi:hypothetical protein [Clostridium beijerinckii]|uniref:hypothetical protein n=1 Tax=Clostridium beijerinckii TaxID=1520 RepID=UPI00098C0C62|nr:hypothetical protein [Clostridium beijerinckii]NRT35324.1 hypothetical protein [Clostridium beijerinckii]NRT45247.1 hypothetical protein [Clostridium beijerinckii]NRU38977.1 hypothetical protein [Clostridium beijerinckii]NRZ20756.1 hypothetical protein [Clostridium beijerinckii]NSA97744.1 hypothetical protein [Clostridium beijerinckii]
MEDLIIDNNIFKISNYHMNEFYGIYIDADFRLSTGHMCYLPSKNQIFFSINNYKDASNIASHLDELEKYKDNFCYIKMDVETLQTTCYCESEGVPYDLFQGPNDEIWCVIGYSKTSLNRVVCLPIGDRKDIEDCKPVVSVAEHIFRDGDKILSYTDGTFNKKPTKLGEYKFSKTKHFQSVKRVKIEEPLVSRCLYNEEGIQAFSTIDENVILHRLLDDKVVSIKERKVYVEGIFLDAYFEKNSPVINWKNHETVEVTANGGSIFHVERPSEIFYVVYGIDGERIEEKKLFEFTELCSIYYMESVKLDNDTYALTFTYGSDDEPTKGGNGWLAVRSGELLECWLQHKDKKSYIDQVTGKKITLNMDNVILRKFKACGRSYSIYFDGIIDSKHRNRAAVVIKNLI